VDCRIVKVQVLTRSLVCADRAAETRLDGNQKKTSDVRRSNNLAPPAPAPACRTVAASRAHKAIASYIFPRDYTALSHPKAPVLAKSNVFVPHVVRLPQRHWARVRLVEPRIGFPP
jgi:hypothetical protein